MAAGEDIVLGYCKQAGLAAPPPRADGTYVLYVDDEFELQLTPQDRNRLRLRSDLPVLEGGPDRQSKLARLLRINLALSNRKRSSLALDDGGDTPFLYDVLTVDPADFAPSFKSISTFANEVVAFHRALERAR